MTGQFIYRGPNLKTPLPISKKVVGGIPGSSNEASAKVGKHTHVIFTLDRGGVLYFNDYRRFGWMELIQKSKVKSQNFIKKLGPEFLKDMTIGIFLKILAKSKKPIKMLLMDQTKMAGVGNIYANDALWLAKINPQRKANSLEKNEQSALFKGVEGVLKEGIRRGGE
jgi:formamidopyrimidine-DNA glycosylase